MVLITPKLTSTYDTPAVNDSVVPAENNELSGLNELSPLAISVERVLPASLLGHGASTTSELATPRANGVRLDQPAVGRETRKVGRGDNLTTIIDETYRDLKLSNAEKFELINEVVDLNRDRYPRLTRNHVGRGWELTLPSLREVAGDPLVAPPTAGGKYVVTRGDTPLGVIRDSYRIDSPSGSRELTPTEQMKVLRASVQLNTHLPKLSRGRIGLGDEITLPSGDSLKELLGADVHLILQLSGPTSVEEPAAGAIAVDPAGLEDTTASVGREHIVRPAESYIRVIRNNYAVPTDGGTRPLTRAEEGRLADLTQQLNPKFSARKLRPGNTIQLPSEQLIQQRLGIAMRFKSTVVANAGPATAHEEVEAPLPRRHPTDVDESHTDHASRVEPANTSGLTGYYTRANWGLKYFTPNELAQHGSPDVVQIDKRTGHALDRMRELYGAPIRIQSGYRSRAYNERLYRARGKKPTNSQHTHARAVDVNMAGMSSAQRKRLLKAVFDAGFSSIGFYEGSSNMLHIDTRSSGRTWGTQPSWARDIMRDRFTGGMKPFGGR